jgi:purine-nucleoside phosphorylase
MAPSSRINKIDRAARALRDFSQAAPRLALVLGSGFVGSLQDFQVEHEIGFEDIPGFALPKVAGHQGKCVLIREGKTHVLVLCGRTHYYEGHAMEDIVFPIRVLPQLGIRDLLLTNAAGGVNPRFQTGDLMVLTDHINLMGVNPLREAMPARADRFVDLTNLYEPGLRKCLKTAARSTAMKLREGVYLAVSGPSFETPAEIRVFRKWGVDAVGMSTVPEAIAARQCGLRVAALSCITNPAAGLSKRPLSHEDVLAVGRESCHRSSRLIRQFILEYAKDFPS